MMEKEVYPEFPDNSVSAKNAHTVLNYRIFCGSSKRKWINQKQLSKNTW